MKYDVDTNLLIHCRVRVTVEVASKEQALDAACDLLPSNFDRGASDEWGAKIELKPPEGVEIKLLRAVWFEQATGDEKVRKTPESK